MLRIDILTLSTAAVIPGLPDQPNGSQKFWFSNHDGVRQALGDYYGRYHRFLRKQRGKQPLALWC